VDGRRRRRLRSREKLGGEPSTRYQAGSPKELRDLRAAIERQSNSHVKPTPPWIWTFSAAARESASLQLVLATLAASASSPAATFSCAATHHDQ
jgi:hypothetical protein